MIRGFIPRLTATAQAISRFVLETQIARLALMAVKLWPRLRLLSILLALLVIACIAVAGFAAYGVFLALSPASPSGIGAGIAAVLTALVVLTLCAFTAIAGIEALLQLAHDFGRHRVGALLALATILAAAVAVRAAPDAADLNASDWAAPAIALILLAMTGWFQRTYRRPARRDFRDFHVDVVGARHYLARAAHGG